AKPTLVLTLSSLCLSSSAQLRADDQALFFDQTGYRIDRFRAAVPESVDGAKTIDTHEAKRLLTADGDLVPILIDVLPTPPRPSGLSERTLWLPPAHRSIPHTAWLPNVGYGRISDELDAYFRDNLQRLTEGNKNRPVIVFCQADCWMSWNAARRAVEYGHQAVYWYPDGTTGWEAEGLSLEAIEPVPMD
ncbi:MAG: PQQ-dependent catabolism-associated CXXCW motif protein, partial [Thiohalocapsa sp.]